MASLDELRTFLAVYRAGTLTAAAQALHLSQPSVSAHLRALEEEIGTPLFVRRARGVEPTARGEALARAVADPLDSLAAIRAGIGAGQVDLAGEPAAHASVWRNRSRMPRGGRPVSASNAPVSWLMCPSRMPLPVVQWYSAKRGTTPEATSFWW